MCSKSRVGAWITTHEYLAGLVARGHQVDVIVQISNELVQPTYDLDGVHVHPRTWDQYAHHLVISHLGDNHEGAFAAQRAGVPSVRMVHGFDPQGAVKLDQTPTALAVFSSAALAKDTGWHGNQMVAHPPVRRTDYETTTGPRVTLINLNPQKGGKLLAQIAEATPDVDFLGVKGWGRFQQVTQPWNVEVIDPAEDVREVFCRTRILLMPSDYESYGRVAVEAACSGIPTIAHPSPGLREAMGDAATWVDRTDLAGWVKAIRWMQEPGAWTEASRRSRRAIQTDPEATISAVVDAIEATVKVAA